MQSSVEAAIAGYLTAVLESGSRTAALQNGGGGGRINAGDRGC
jgi:hypothetical protein